MFCSTSFREVIDVPGKRFCQPLDGAWIPQNHGSSFFKSSFNNGLVCETEYAKHANKSFPRADSRSVIARKVEVLLFSYPYLTSHAVLKLNSKAALARNHILATGEWPVYKSAS
jgi:hypothetical protein